MHLLNVISSLSIPCPQEIIHKVYGDIFICNGNDAYEFMEFEGKEVIEFFKNLEYIVSYNELKDMTEEELMLYGEEINNEINVIINQFNSETEQSRKESYEYVSGLVDSKKLKMLGVRDFIWYKTGKLKINLPKGIDDSMFDSHAKNHGIKKLIRSIFHNKK